MNERGYMKKISIIIFLTVLFLIQSYCERPKIGLVLSGGGAKGIAHIGVLKVLERAGIKPDYIAGTSMGSIIGGLYAAGYSAEQLENIVLREKRMSWDDLLSDKISRRHISMEEKDEEGRFFFKFPLKEGGIRLPKGLITGQNISLEFSRLCIPVHHIDKFESFPIPFRCVATNLATGEEKVFSEGYLPDALRASMSIPSVFTPAEVNGEYFIDGGVVNNFPVQECIDMGADIIIGCDVGTHLYETDELNSLIKIMEQTVNFAGAESIAESRKLCDYLILPDIKEYSAADFNSADSLIIIGEKAAEEQFSELKKLGDSLKRFDSYNLKRPRISMKEYVLNIKKLEFKGLDKTSKELLTAQLKLKIPSEITVEQLEKAVLRAYGSRYYESVTYKLKPMSGGVACVIRVKEQNSDFFRLGVHYNSDDNAMVMLNFEFRNFWLQGTKAQVSAVLAENPQIGGSYFIQKNIKPGIRFGPYAAFSKMKFDLYDQGELTANIEFKHGMLGFILEVLFSHSFLAGIKLDKEFLDIDSRLQLNDSIKFDNNYAFDNAALYLKIDTYDRKFFPTSGIKFFGQVEAYNNKLFRDDNDYAPFQKAYFDFGKRIGLSDKFVWLTDLFGSYTRGDSIPEEYKTHVGGHILNRGLIIPFYGLNFGEIAGNYIGVVRTGFQYRIFENIYLSTLFNVGLSSRKAEDFFSENKLVYGAGVKLSYETIIGPINWSISSSSESREVKSYLSIGYAFSAYEW